jgi:hypothetical protein
MVMVAVIGGLGVAVVGVAPGRPAHVPADPVRTIPLGSCYSTFDGSGCRQLTQGISESPGQELGRIYAKHQGGASNVVLVHGKDITAAVKAACGPLIGGAPADTPALPDPDAGAAKREPLWLAAYLGIAGNTSIGWRVHAAETRGLTARLTYSQSRRTGPIGSIVLQYLVWVPLGEVRAGTYTLELYDADRKEAMLSRRVTVAGR